MEKLAKNDKRGSMYAERMTPGGLAVVLCILAAFVAVFLLSYPLADVSRGTALSTFLGSTRLFFYTVMGLIGLLLIAIYRKNITTYEVVLGVLMATIVCMAIETNYWSTDWSFSHPNYDVCHSGIVTFLMTLGALAMLKTEQVLRVQIAEENFWKMARSILFGCTMGLPFAVINIYFFAVIEQMPWAVKDIFSSIIVAMWPAIMGGIACRLLIIGLALIVLRRYLPKNATIAASLLAGAFTLPIINSSGQLLTTPVEALVGIVVMGLLFGLPMALLAYYRDVESAISFHWIVNLAQYALGY